MKNKSGLKKCENFCKNDYALEMEKGSVEFYKKHLNEIKELNSLIEAMSPK